MKKKKQVIDIHKILAPEQTRRMGQLGLDFMELEKRVKKNILFAVSLCDRTEAIQSSILSPFMQVGTPSGQEISSIALAINKIEELLNRYNKLCNSQEEERRKFDKESVKKFDAVLKTPSLYQTVITDREAELERIRKLISEIEQLSVTIEETITSLEKIIKANIN